MIRRYAHIRDADILQGAHVAALLRGDEHVTPVGPILYTEDGRVPHNLVATILALYGVDMVDVVEYRDQACGHMVALGAPMSSWAMRDALIEPLPT